MEKCLALFGCWLSLLLPVAWAEPATPGPDGELVLPFSLPMPATEVESLLVELDGYDASAFARVEPGRVLLMPAVPLAPGEHRVVVMALLRSGEVEPVTERLFFVSGALADTLQYDLLLSNHYRFAEKEKTDFRDVPHYGSQGAASLRAAGHGPRWRSNAELDFLYDNRGAHNPSGDEFDLPHYRLDFDRRGERVNLGMTLGHQQVAVNDLLFDGFNRRGVGLRLGDDHGLARLDVFALHSQVVTSAEEGLLLPGESQRSTYGARATAALLPSHPEWLQLSAGYVDGEGAWGGAGVVSLDSATVFGGESWNISTDSWFWQRALWLHLEYAESRFDSDGLDQGADAERDNAHQIVLQLSSGGDIQLPGLDSWSATAQRQQVGFDFYSIANLTLPGDRELDRLLLQAARGGLGAELSLERERSDVDDDPSRPRQRIDRSRLALQYTPTVDTARGAWRYLGSPAYSAHYFRSARDQSDSDALLVAYDLDDVSTETGAGVNFSHALWNWGLQFNRIRYRDDSQTLIDNGFLLYQPVGDSDTDTVTLLFSYYPSSRFYITPSLLWSDVEQDASGDVYSDLSLSFDSGVQLLPQKLHLNLGYSLDRNRSNYGDALYLDGDFRSQIANVDLRWFALQQRSARPGLDVFLRGSYGRQHDDNYAFAKETYQLLLGFDLRWANGE